jgi:hypothetical protein
MQDVVMLDQVVITITTAFYRSACKNFEHRSPAHKASVLIN